MSNFYVRHEKPRSQRNINRKAWNLETAKDFLINTAENYRNHDEREVSLMLESWYLQIGGAGDDIEAYRIIEIGENE